jgi:dienelactone hydrolase
MTKLKSVISFIFIVLLSGCATKIDISDPWKTFPYIVTHETPRPTVLVAHGCDGFDGSPMYIKWAFEFYSAGYNAVLIDSFGFRGHKDICIRGKIISPDVRADDFESAAKWIKEQSWHSGGIAVVGFSHGGSTALSIANNPGINNIDAVVAYYPGCAPGTIGRWIYKPRIPAQVHFGDSDDWTPAHECGAMENYQTYHYPNATHAFDIPWNRGKNKWGYNLIYNQEATELSKQRVFEFLDKTIKD